MQVKWNTMSEIDLEVTIKKIIGANHQSITNISKKAVATLRAKMQIDRLRPQSRCSHAGTSLCSSCAHEKSPIFQEALQTIYFKITMGFPQFLFRVPFLLGKIHNRHHGLNVSNATAFVRGPPRCGHGSSCHS